MFALYKTADFLIGELSIHFKKSLEHEGEVTILRLLSDLSNFQEPAGLKYERWLNRITSN